MNKFINLIPSWSFILLAVIFLVSCPDTTQERGRATIVEEGPNAFVVVFPDIPVLNQRGDQSALKSEIYKRYEKLFSAFDGIKFSPGDLIQARVLNGDMTLFSSNIVGRHDSPGTLAAIMVDDYANLLIKSETKSADQNTGEPQSLWNFLSEALRPLNSNPDVRGQIFVLVGFFPQMCEVTATNSEVGNGAATCGMLPTPKWQDFMQHCQTARTLDAPVISHEAVLLKKEKGAIQELASSGVMKRCKVAFVFPKNELNAVYTSTRLQELAQIRNKAVAPFAQEVLVSAIEYFWRSSLSSLGGQVGGFGNVTQAPWEPPVLPDSADPWKDWAPKKGETCYFDFPPSIFEELPAVTPTAQQPQNSLESQLVTQKIVVTWEGAIDLEVAAWIGGQRLDWYQPQEVSNSEPPGSADVRYHMEEHPRAVEVIVQGKSSRLQVRVFVRSYGGNAFYPTNFRWKYQDTLIQSSLNGTGMLRTQRTREMELERLDQMPEPAFGWQEILLNNNP